MSEIAKLPTLSLPIRKDSNRRLASTSKIVRHTIQENTNSMRKIYGHKLPSMKNENLNTMPKIPLPRTSFVKPDSKTKRKSNPHNTMELLSYQIQKAESDLCELKRDLSTYDHELCQNSNISSNLKKILSVDLSEIMIQFETMNNCSQVFSKDIKEKLETIGKAKLNSDVCTEECEDYKLKQKNDKFATKTLFTGIKRISGCFCLITIKEQIGTNRIHISASVNYQKPIELFYIEEGIKDVNSILDKTYLTVDKSNNILLNVRASCDKDFSSLVFNLTGWGLCSVIIHKNTGYTHSLYFQEMNQSLEIYSDTDSFRDLKKLLTQRLVYNKATGNISWEESLYEKKERMSIFMNDEISDCDLNQIQIVDRFHYTLENRNVLIEIIKQNKAFKLKLTSDSIHKEICTASKEYQLMTGLQGIDFSRDILTAKSSLEFRYVIAKLLSF